MPFVLVCVTAVARQAQAEPVVFEHPVVLDSATFRAGDTTVGLSGIDGLAGEYAGHLQNFLAADGDRLTCEKQADAAFVCRMQDGADLAQVVLLNGAARARQDAPAPYHEQEEAAQAARRGVWAAMPPPPEVLTHPTVQDTATVWADGTKYVLQGLTGLGAPYAGEMQDYIVAQGNSLTCLPQVHSGHFVCMLPDGTDLAEVALQRGAARLGLGAPNSYRARQLEAANARRGTWQTAGDPEITVVRLAARADETRTDPGDDHIDGITYAGGAPAAVIGGAAVFLVYADRLGWGYYDRLRHWHGAPEQFRAHLERLHPEIDGLPGHAGDGRARGEAIRYDPVVRVHEAVVRQAFEAVPGPAIVRTVAARPAVARVAVVRPAVRTAVSPRSATRGPTPERPVQAASSGHLHPVTPQHVAPAPHVGLHR